MNYTVIDIFEKSEAEKVVKELEKDDYARNDINVVTKYVDPKKTVGKLKTESASEAEAKQ